MKEEDLAVIRKSYEDLKLVKLSDMEQMDLIRDKLTNHSNEHLNSVWQSDLDKTQSAISEL